VLLFGMGATLPVAARVFSSATTKNGGVRIDSDSEGKRVSKHTSQRAHTYRLRTNVWHGSKTCRKQPHHFLPRVNSYKTPIDPGTIALFIPIGGLISSMNKWLKGAGAAVFAAGSYFAATGGPAGKVATSEATNDMGTHVTFPFAL
jgi:hypothetical protein